MTIVSQKTDARNELAGAGFVRAPNVGIVKDATGRVLAPISVTPEAFTTDIADIQGQFPIVWNTERMPYASAVHNTQYYYDNTVVGGAITTTVTTLPIGKGVVSEEGGYVLLDISKDATARYANTWTPTANVETVHTHALSAGEDIQIQVRDATTKEIVNVEIRIISATTFGVTSTTTADLRVIAL